MLRRVTINSHIKSSVCLAMRSLIGCRLPSSPRAYLSRELQHSHCKGTYRYSSRNSCHSPPAAWTTSLKFSSKTNGPVVHCHVSAANHCSTAAPLQYSDARCQPIPKTLSQSEEISVAGVGSGDTIAAIVTGVGGSVAVIRLSGPHAVDIVAKIFRVGRDTRSGDAKWQPESHRVDYGRVVDVTDGDKTVDEVLVLPMIGRRSYTAEDVVEVHTHGGGVCSTRVLHLCLEGGARLAQPGEFTLRAFLNGRLDLAQAESVGELIGAQTTQGAESALATLQGGLSKAVSHMRALCVNLLVEMEARLDFEDDLPPLLPAHLVAEIEGVKQLVEAALETAERGRLLRAGMAVAIVGRPNVGKSSLLNAWSDSERAIVTDVAGTTRDVVEATVVTGGIPVRVLDTAGMRDTEDVVEGMGVKRSEAAAQGADVILFVVSAADGWTPEDSATCQRIWGQENSSISGQQDNDKRRKGGLAGPMSRESGTGTQEAPRGATSAPTILVVNKSDCGSKSDVLIPEQFKSRFFCQVATSATERRGLDSLEEAVLELVGLNKVAVKGNDFAVNQRQAEQLIRARDALTRLKSSILDEMPIDFWTIEVREAALALGEISGDEVAEEVLTQIFSRFCIGK